MFMFLTWFPAKVFSPHFPLLYLMLTVLSLIQQAINVTIHYCYYANSSNGPITSAPSPSCPLSNRGRSFNHFLFDLVVKLLLLQPEN